MPPPVDFNRVPLLHPLVAAFRLVCALTYSVTRSALSTSTADFRPMAPGG